MPRCLRAHVWVGAFLPQMVPEPSWPLIWREEQTGELCRTKKDSPPGSRWPPSDGQLRAVWPAGHRSNPGLPPDSLPLAMSSGLRGASPGSVAGVMAQECGKPVWALGMATHQECAWEGGNYAFGDHVEETRGCPVCLFSGEQRQ